MYGVVNVFPGGVACVLDASVVCVVVLFDIDDEISFLALKSERTLAESVIETS